MAGYIGSKSSVTQVDGYNRTEADAEFVNDPNDVITVNGSNVGIATSSPFSTLSTSVGSNAPSTSGNMASHGATIHNGPGGRAVQIGLYETGAYNYIQSGYVNNANVAVDLAFFTGASETLRIGGSGKLGINTSSPAQALHVQDAGTNATGTIKLGNDYHGYVQQYNNDLNIISNGDQAYRAALGTNNGTGNIVFQTANGTTGNTQRMRIDSLGRVTMPYQPCFSAGGSGNLAWSAGSLSIKIIPLTYVPQNVGGHFSASTYRFTAPVAGNYFFAGKITQTGSAAGPSMKLYKNGSVHGFEMAIGYYTAYHSTGGEAIVPLAANDYVDMRVQNNNNSAMTLNISRCTLSGFLIG